MSVQEDVTHVRHAEDAIRSGERAEREARYRELLLMELNHRVKNNLQTIASMLRIQFGETADEAIQAMLASSLHRVQAIALVHEHLSVAESYSNVAPAPYLRKLADSVLGIHGGTTQISLHVVEGDPVPLAPELFMHLGMIVCELIVNALRHAFVGRPSGNLRIFVGETEGVGRLVVEDDGVGITSAAEHSASSLGLRLVQSFVGRIRGELQLDAPPGGGVRVVVLFPLPAS